MSNQLHTGGSQPWDAYRVGNDQSTGGPVLQRIRNFTKHYLNLDCAVLLSAIPKPQTLLSFVSRRAKVTVRDVQCTCARHIAR